MTSLRDIGTCIFITGLMCWCCITLYLLTCAFILATGMLKQHSDENNFFKKRILEKDSIRMSDYSKRQANPRSFKSQGPKLVRARFGFE